MLIVASQLLADVEPDDGPGDLGAGPATRATLPDPASSTPSTVTLPPVSGPVRLDETSLFDGPGVGPVETGMTLGEAEQAAGRRFTVSGRSDAGVSCFTAAPEGLVGLRFTVRGPVDDPRQGRIARAEATDSTWSTATGARVGSTVEEVKRLYRNRLDRAATTTTVRRSGSATTSTVSTAGMLKVTVRDGARTVAVGFVTSERQVVSAMYSGDAGAVSDPAGCG